ncbi:MAG: alpha/beta hydrolase [Rhodospirillales bacterium]
MRLITDPVQQRRSWYMYLLTGPLGEPALAWNDFALVDRLWADWSPGFDPGAEYMQRLKETFRQPGVALAAASYYKHVFLPALQDVALVDLQARIGTTPITMPSLYLHGAQDGCIGADIETERSLFTGGLKTMIVPEAGHFLHLEKPELVNAAILQFLQHAGRERLGPGQGALPPGPKTACRRCRTRCAAGGLLYGLARRGFSGALAADARPGTNNMGSGASGSVVPSTPSA